MSRVPTSRSSRTEAPLDCNSSMVHTPISTINQEISSGQRLRIDAEYCKGRAGVSRAVYLHRGEKFSRGTGNMQNRISLFLSESSVYSGSNISTAYGIAVGNNVTNCHRQSNSTELEDASPPSRRDANLLLSSLWVDIIRLCVCIHSI